MTPSPKRRALSRKQSRPSQSGTRADLEAKFARLKTGVAQAVVIDFFGANGRETVDGLLAELEVRLMEKDNMGQHGRRHHAIEGHGTLRGRVWVTRQRCHVTALLPRG